MQTKIDGDTLKVLEAINTLAKHREEYKDGYERLKEFIDIVLKTASLTHNCPVCGTKFNLYVITYKQGEQK